jgi:hypothetical protein
MMSETKTDDHNMVSHIEDEETLPTSKEELYDAFQELSDREAAISTCEAARTYKRVLIYYIT